MQEKYLANKVLHSNTWQRRNYNQIQYVRCIRTLLLDLHSMYMTVSVALLRLSEILESLYSEVLLQML